MVKFRTLKFMARTFTPRDWRCHKRRVFFEELFEDLKEVKDEDGNHVSGYIQHDYTSYTNGCHDMAADISYYPFEKEVDISDMGEFFTYAHTQDLYRKLEVSIIRKSPLWKVFTKYGEYEVEVTGTDYRGIPIDFKYTKKMKLP